METRKNIWDFFNLNSFPGRPATYDGEVYQGRRHGEGVFKSGRTSMMYSGGWADGKRNGKGKMIYDAEGRSFYEGDWINNKKFGWGRYQYLSGKKIISPSILSGVFVKIFSFLYKVMSMKECG